MKMKPCASLSALAVLSLVMAGCLDASTGDIDSGLTDEGLDSGGTTSRMSQLEPSDVEPGNDLRTLNLTKDLVFTGAEGPDGRWIPLTNLVPLFRGMVNCHQFTNYTEAGVVSASITIEQAGDNPIVENWLVGVGFISSRIFEMNTGELPLTVEMSNVTDVLTRVKDGDFMLLYALPNDPTPNVAVREELTARIQVKATNPDLLEYNVDAVHVCY